MSDPSSSGAPRARPTKLQQRLAGDDAGLRRTPLDAFDLAMRAFLAGDRVDMAELREQLGVSRATLYRWVGSRDQLLTEVLWAYTRTSLDSRRSDAHRKNPTTADLLTGLLHDMVCSPEMQRLLESEGHGMLARLMGPGSVYNSRLVAMVRELIATDVTRGAVTLGVPVDDLAYTVVQLIQAHVVHGVGPATCDIQRATRVLRVLLQ